MEKKELLGILGDFKRGDLTLNEANERILILFSINYYGETLYNTDGVIPSKFEDEKPRIATFKDHCR